jgi:colanic acid/amylovoran biosynthesis glycosyltransferase
VPESSPVSDVRAGDTSRGTRPRLLVLASTYPARAGDGTPGFVADLAKVEADAFDTVVLAPLVPGGRLREERDGYQVRRYRFFPRRWEDLADGAILENLRARPSRFLQVPFLLVAGALAVRRAVRDVAPDVLHVHWIIPQGLMALVSARRVPWLVTTLGGDLYALRAAPLRALKRQVLRRAAAVTVMNADMRQVVVDLGVPAEKVRVLPMGVALGRIQQAQLPAERIRGRLVFVGRLVEKKGVEVLLDALQQLPDGLEWSLDVVGDGPLRADLERRASGLGDRVTFLGQQSAPDLAALLARAEVAVFPSVRARSGDQDGLPVALLEAMAAGTPVVASDLPGLGDAVVGTADGEPLPPAGRVVPAGDPAELAAVIAALLGDPGQRQCMSDAGVARAATYSIDTIGARYAELLHGAIRTKQDDSEREQR